MFIQTLGASLVDCGALIVCYDSRHKIFQPGPLYAYEKSDMGLLFECMHIGELALFYGRFSHMGGFMPRVN